MRQKIYTVGMVICLAVMLVSGFMIVRGMLEKWQRQREFGDLAALVQSGGAVAGAAGDGAGAAGGAVDGPGAGSGLDGSGEAGPASGAGESGPGADGSGGSSGDLGAGPGSGAGDGSGSGDGSEVAGVASQVPSGAATVFPNTNGLYAIGSKDGKTAFETYIAVYERNPDLVGWISIPDTQINYPVMQTVAEPDYYLKKDFEKKASAYGVPYIQENCVIAKNVVSDNLIIYSHNMKNGTMFHALVSYQKKAFYDKHPYIYFDTLYGFGKYEIIAAFKTEADSAKGFAYYDFVDAHSEKEFDAYVESVKGIAFYDTGVGAVYGDKLITLSTCEYTLSDGRFVVVAKQVPWE
jgi:sortase B